MISAIWGSSGCIPIRSNDIPSREKSYTVRSACASQVAVESRTHSIFRFQAYPASRNDKICGFLFESNLHEVFKGEVERKIDFEPSSQSQGSSVEELPVAASDKRRVESSLSIRSEVVNCSDSDDVPLAVVVSGLNKTKRRKKINPPRTESQRE
ncbi:hypothetical protein JG687_00013622, partial [Phytophthora cactorum]